MQRTGRARAHLVPVVCVYGSALLAGLSVVSFPASANHLKEAHGFSDAQYGAIFLPQLALSLAGAVLGGALVRRLGIATLLRLALLAFLCGEGALAATAQLASLAYPLLLAGTALVGFGFGIAAAPLNSFPGALFPRRAETAIVALHTLAGAGFALGPVLIGAVTEQQAWTLAPLSACALTLALLAASLGLSDPARGNVTPAQPDARTGIDSFVMIAVLYAFAEGTFSNWASIYLREERGVAASAAALALSAFWGALVLARLLASALLLRVTAARVWLALPPLMAAAFLALPAAHDARSGVLLFAFAGLTCGAFFPLTVGQALARTALHPAAVSGWLTAGLMFGSGLGSFLIGPLRAHLDLAHIYLLSSSYPLLAGILARRLVSRDPRHPQRAASTAERQANA
jgi:fucose permease